MKLKSELKKLDRMLGKTIKALNDFKKALFNEEFLFVLFSNNMGVRQFNRFRDCMDELFLILSHQSWEEHGIDFEKRRKEFENAYVRAVMAYLNNPFATGNILEREAKPILLEWQDEVQNLANQTRLLSG